MPGHRCQLCDLVVHEHCINNIVTCKRYTVCSMRILDMKIYYYLFQSTDYLSVPATPHNFLHEQNFLSVFCEHDGK